MNNLLQTIYRGFAGTVEKKTYSTKSLVGISQKTSAIITLQFGELFQCTEFQELALLFIKVLKLS